VDTVSMLETLLGVINSRTTKTPPSLNNPNLNPQNTQPSSGPAGPAPNTSTTAGPGQNPAGPPTWQQPNPLEPASGAPQQQPQTQQPQQNPPTEESLRQQLNQADLYDLSGEKAAAEALKRDDAFKQQQIEEKAQQTKDFFAQQDQKQQETYQEIQKQADQQLQEKAQKEFWDQKQQTEMQAGMDKEMQSLHQAALQEHQEWRNDFTQGICRDDVAALYNKNIADRTEAYKARLDDLGTNATVASETIAKYQVKLQDEVAPEIEQKATELHQEHFPESDKPAWTPETMNHGPDSHGPEHRPEHPEEDEHEEAESSSKVRKTGPGISDPSGGNNADMPGLGGRDAINSSPGNGGGGSGSGGSDGGSGSNGGSSSSKEPGVDEAADASAYAALKFREKMDAQAEGASVGPKQDIPDGWMKPIDPPISQQAREAAQQGWETTKENAAAAEAKFHAGTLAAGQAIEKGMDAVATKAEDLIRNVKSMDEENANSSTIAAADIADEKAGELVTGGEHLGVAVGLPHDVQEQIATAGQFYGSMGPEAWAALIKKTGADIKDGVDSAKDTVQEVVESAKSLATPEKEREAKIEQAVQESQKNPEIKDNVLTEDIQKIDREKALHTEQTKDLKGLLGNEDFQKGQFAEQTDKLKNEFASQDRATTDLYAKNTATDPQMLQTQNEVREGIKSDTIAQRSEATRGICEQEATRLQDAKTQESVEYYKKSREGLAGPQDIERYQSMLEADKPKIVEGKTADLQQQTFPDLNSQPQASPSLPMAAGGGNAFDPNAVQRQAPAPEPTPVQPAPTQQPQVSGPSLSP
jgi:hypothetical protein